MTYHDISGRIENAHRQRWRRGGRLVGHLLLRLVCAGALVLVGCDGDDDDAKAPQGTPPGSNATAANLTNQAFTFATGEVFGIDPNVGPVALTFGNFTGNKGPFRLVAVGGNTSATGEATVGPCELQVTIGNFAAAQGPQAGAAPIKLDTCTLDSNGALRAENRALGKTATSGIQAAAANPPGGIGRLTTPSRSTSIALTADDRYAVVANRETHSVAVIEVRDRQG